MTHEVREQCYFFFSSRRRHTRFDCDWSSDVCSSDWLANRSPRHPVVVAEPTEPRFVGGHGGGETEPGRTFVKPPTEGSGPADPWRQGGGETGPAAPLSGPPRKAPAPPTPGAGGGGTGPGRPP